MDYAVLAYTQMENPNVFVFNAMIKGFVQSYQPVQALELYVQMLRANVSPTSYTFPSLIKACGLVSQLRFAEAVHGHVWRNGFDSHVFVQTSLVDLYSSMGRIEESVRVFDEMPERDVFAWTTMISGLVRNKRFREALGVFNEMAKHGIGPDEVTMATVISACAHLGALDLGKEIHYYIMQHGFNLDVYIGSALIDMYAKCGSLDRSLLMFFKLREKNLFCWNSVIEGLAVHGYAEEALAMFDKMEREKIKPNGVTFVSVLSACNHAGLIEEGRKRFASMTRDHSIPPGVEHYGCMVDLLSKAGLLEEALQLIRTMKLEPNAVIWGALLSGCKLHRNLEIAQAAANKLMVLEPGNSGYYTLMVNMNAEVNRWGEAAKIRLTMKEQGVEKRCPGSSWIEMESQVHQFAASDKSHAASDGIYLLLAELDGQMKLAGYVKQRQWSRGVVQSHMKKIVENSVQKCRDDSGSRIVLVKDIFYGALYIIALAAGSGGTKPNISTMGADQFDGFQPKEDRKLSFFNWWMFSIFFGTLFSNTLVYIQDNVGWTLGYALPTLGLAVSIIVFLVGTPFYRLKLPAESPFTRMAQVLVAAVKKWKVPIPDDPKQLHELSLDEYIGSGKELTIPLLLVPATLTIIIQHSQHQNTCIIIYLPFLDKAAVESGSSSPWMLCPVTQVEETKQMIKMLPVWAATFIPSTILAQVHTLFIKQGTVLDRSMALHKKTERNYTAAENGIGFMLHVIVMITACLAERKRLSVAREHNIIGKNEVVPLSIFILLPQFVLMGVADNFVEVAKIEFFYDQSPEGMKSLGTSCFTSSLGIGNFLGSFILSTVSKITKKHGHKGWILDNLNLSHLDYYYAVLAILSFLNFLLYLVAANFFVYNVDVDSKSDLQGIKKEASLVEAHQERKLEG
ncbi:hypothetical protein POTOM_011204 [Populus tomentosa]|uniref:Uncharacterized protein n=1 Tax=Populus tomentosa TaxID=118781 RepID=A0A8X8AES8_POPTO|nr:hypothetical protein POTOM_011204 [Populus tomentosa]